MPNRKLVAKIHKIRGRYYKLVPYRRGDLESKLYWCTGCDLRVDQKTLPIDTRWKLCHLEKRYCWGHVYKELDPLHADFVKVKEAKHVKDR
jgi:hypothetical protein